MQKRKSFLMKLLVVLTVAFCTFAIAISMVGCAADGKDGKDGLSIQSATINANGELVLTYTDGSTQTVGTVKGEAGEQGPTGEQGETGAQGPAGVTKCTCAEGESDIVTYVARVANCQEAGVEIEYCTKCNGMEVITAEVDSAMHGEWVEEFIGDDENLVKILTFKSWAEATPENLDPTCTEKGHISTKCSKCGEVVDSEDVDALGHTYIQASGALDNGNKCMDGEFTVWMCIACGDVYEADDVVDNNQLYPFPVYTEAREYHTADATWTYVTKPTTTTAGSITGTCTYCNETQTIVVPALSAANGYTVTVVSPATCATNGQTKYTKTIADSFVVDLTVATSTAHKVSGVAVDLDKVYTVEEAESLGFEIIANAPLADCQQTGEAVFVCDDCHKTYKVSVSGNHKHAADDEGEVTAPTCYARGYTTYTCIVEGCGEEYQADFTAKVPCNWVLIDTEDNGDGTADMTFKCSMCEDIQVLYNATLIDSEEATCLAAGYRTFKYENPNYDPTVAGSEEYLTITLDDAQLTTHKLAGEQYDVSANSEYRYSQIENLIGNGLDYIANVEVTCTVAGEGVFKCETCTKTFKINVYADHDFTGNDKVIPEASCEGDLDITQLCNTCNKDIVVGTVAQIPHDYQITRTVENVGEDTADITFTCSMCGDSFVIEDAALVEADCVAPTCDAEGKNVYSYVKDGAPATIEVPVAKSTKHIIVAGQDHEEDGFDVTGAVRYEYSDIEGYIGNGLEYIANVEVTCVTPGEGVFKCATCAKTYKINVYATHTWGDTEIKNVTCDEDGYNYQECTAEGCDEILIDELTRVDALGHDYAVEVLENGKVKLTCKRADCGDEKIITPERVAHTIIPECEIDGKDTYFYYESEEDKAEDVANGNTNNLKFIEVVVEALGHNYYAHQVEFQIEIDGKLYDCTGETCTRCGYINILTKTEVEDQNV